MSGPTNVWTSVFCRSLFLQLILLLSFTTCWSNQFHTGVLCCVEKHFFLQFLLNLLLDSFLGVPISPASLNGKPLYHHVSAIHDYVKPFSSQEGTCLHRLLTYRNVSTGLFTLTVVTSLIHPL